MRVTFRQMRLFLMLAETGSVGAAARAMHVSQPTASMQLREVTRAVGMPLYDVVARRVHLTEAGTELARTARAMFAEWEDFGQRIDALKGLERGRLRVAVVSTAKYFVPRILGGFCERHPDIDIALEVLNRDGVVQRLRENRDDLYIMSMPPSDIDVVAQVFMPNPLVLIVPASHRFASRRRIELAALHDERFILREHGSGTRMATDQHFRRVKFAPKLRLELGSNEAIKEAVAGRLGVAVLSRHALGHDHAAAGVEVLTVTGFPIRSNWYVVHLKQRRLSPIAAVFQQHLARAAAAWTER